MQPHHCPEKLAWSPQPLILALHPRRRWILWWALASVIGAFVDASEQLAGLYRSETEMEAKGILEVGHERRWKLAQSPAHSLDRNRANLLGLRF